MMQRNIQESSLEYDSSETLHQETQLVSEIQDIARAIINQSKSTDTSPYVDILKKNGLSIPDPFLELILFGQTVEEFAKMCTNGSVRELLQFAEPEKFTSIITLYKTNKEFERMCMNDEVRTMLIYTGPENLKNIITLYNTSKEFERICMNNAIRGVLIYSSSEDLASMLTRCKRKKVHEGTNIEDALDGKASLESAQIRESFERLCGVRYSNEELSFVSLGSKTLEEIYEGLLEVDHHKDEISYLQDRAQRFLSGKSVKKNQEVGIAVVPKKDLSIYIRYYQTVDYPEIAEAFVVLAQQYIANGHARILKNICIIPRRIDFPTIAQSLFNETTKLYQVMGDEFKKVLHDGSLAVFLSHSTNSTPDGVPSIVSSGTSAGKNDIPLGMELQYAYQNGNNFAQTASLEEVFEAFWRSLQALEQKYIELQRD